jgi:cytochrome c biogenesis protein CcmG, thiol:disulfide interchange protein DsbE
VSMLGFSPGLQTAEAGSVLEEAPRIGYLAPRFKLPGVDSVQLSLADYRGRVVLVNFWATWCAPCLREMPDLAALQAAFPAAQFTVLGVNEDGKLEPVLKFLKDAAVNFPILLDDRRVMRRYDVRGLPATFLIDRDGVIIDKILGPREWSSVEWKRRIASLIGLPENFAPEPPTAPSAATPASE